MIPFPRETREAGKTLGDECLHDGWRVAFRVDAHVKWLYRIRKIA
jgi:hypothetical protein